MLEKFEKLSKIIATLAIPLVLWWLGTQYQSADTLSRTGVEYVKLSIAILENENEADPALLQWASDTLNHYSEVKLGAQLKGALAAGRTNISPDTMGDGWFAVIGSSRTRAGAEILVREFSDLPQFSNESTKLQIYKTATSGHYAVTVGDEINKSEAIRVATNIRESGFISDAYAQRNREWNKIKIK